MNLTGHESANDRMCDGRDLPWLQDTAEQDVWATWDPTWRDVIILDSRNRVFTVVNLTNNNLAVAENYEVLKQLLRDAGES